jgi:hypothetical protein
MPPVIEMMSMFSDQRYTLTCPAPYLGSQMHDQYIGWRENTPIIPDLVQG